MPYKIRLLLSASCFAILFIVVVFVVQLSRSSLQGAVIGQLIIPSTSTTGIMFQAPVRGVYLFEYASGGFLVYDLPEGLSCDRSGLKCFNTAVVGYRGKAPQWLGNVLNYSTHVFALGEPNSGWTLEEAEMKAVGNRAAVGLQAGEQVTLVAGDLRDAYYDNTGEIVVNVYVIST